MSPFGDWPQKHNTSSFRRTGCEHGDFHRSKLRWKLARLPARRAGTGGTWKASIRLATGLGGRLLPRLRRVRLPLLRRRNRHRPSPPGGAAGRRRQMTASRRRRPASHGGRGLAGATPSSSSRSCPWSPGRVRSGEGLGVWNREMKGQGLACNFFFSTPIKE